ncbi:hypothetical protein C7444_11710 [Sphaerotilus hippei]|uniref:Uncharacterized protein n=1 Tax=Sphaerotilus hippei TaxID=744406 RepID=A0A318H0B5_9BURK|nr:hypothetical protein [Sphaerotilus hippei]PXW93806.1 hypothetical protein C7444_11710 [Sphaerotilus hippei]
MKTLTKFVLLPLLGLILMLLLAVWLCFEQQPRVLRGSELTPADIARARSMLRDADPRRAPPGTVRNFAASPRDLDVLLNDVSQRLLHGSARVDLATGVADVYASVHVPRSPLGSHWLNVQARLLQSDQGLPELDSLWLGRLPVPAWLAGIVLHQVARHYQVDEELRMGVAMVQRVALTDEGLVISYLWKPEFVDLVKTAVVPAELQARLKLYNDRLVQLVAPSAALPEGHDVMMAALLPALTDLARQRTVAFAQGADRPDPTAVSVFAAHENRAALITLALYTARQPLARIVPAARGWSQPSLRLVQLRGRDDHPLHFLVSAVLAAEGGGRLADAIGVYKEVGDTREGSGFSFDDLAADRAGTRIGQRAVHDALGFQARMAEALQESDFMPDIDGLPSFLTEADFRRQYGGVGEPGYNQVLADIEQRVARLPLLH